MATGGKCVFRVCRAAACGCFLAIAGAGDRHYVWNAECADGWHDDLYFGAPSDIGSLFRNVAYCNRDNSVVGLQAGEEFKLTDGQFENDECRNQNDETMMKSE